MIKIKDPHYAPSIEPFYIYKLLPKLIVLINIAYIVASIFLGHIRHANTKIGIKFNSATNCNIMESPIQKNLSFIPHSTFFLVTSIIKV